MILPIFRKKNYRSKEKKMKLVFMDHTGDTEVEVDNLYLAEELFHEALDGGRMAVKVSPDGRDHLREFDPTAKEIHFTGRMVGG